MTVDISNCIISLSSETAGSANLGANVIVLTLGCSQSFRGTVEDVFKAYGLTYVVSSDFNNSGTYRIQNANKGTLDTLASQLTGLSDYYQDSQHNYNNVKLSLISGVGPSETGTFTATSTPTSTKVSATKTPSLSHSTTQIPSPTGTAHPTNSLSPSSSSTHTLHPSASGSGTPDSTASNTHSAAPTNSQTLAASLPATPDPSNSGTPDSTASNTHSAAPTNSQTLAASLPATPDPSDNGTPDSTASNTHSAAPTNSSPLTSSVCNSLSAECFKNPNLDTFIALPANATTASDLPSTSSSTLTPSQRLLLTAAIPSVILAILLIVATAAFCRARNRRMRQHVAQLRQATTSPTIMDEANQADGITEPPAIERSTSTESTNPDQTIITVASKNTTTDNTTTRPFQLMLPHQEPSITQEGIEAVI